MPTTTTGIFFVRKQRFAETSRDDNGFRLVLRLLDRQGPGATEAYAVTWRGAEAESWWREHASRIGPGTPLQVELHNPRSFPGLTGPETHASAHSLSLAPTAPSWQARTPQVPGHLATN